MKPLIIANWKMNPQNEKEAKELFELVKKGVKNVKNVEVVICPPFVYLANVQHLTPNIKIGSQNCFWEEKGAFTGEISALMLKSMGVEYVILGHSERRKHFNETDEQINKKIKKVLDLGLKPILCIGETFEQREKGETEVIIKQQLTACLKGISWSKIEKKLTIAYEPVWAISGGDPYKTKELPTPEKIERTYIYVKSLLAKMYNKKVVDDIRIIYGGSVNAQNANDYLKDAGMQGLLVGGASLKAKEFVKIVKSAG